MLDLTYEEQKRFLWHILLHSAIERFPVKLDVLERLISQFSRATNTNFHNSEPMSPFSVSNGPDFRWSFGEVVPCVTTEGNDLVLIVKDPV